MTRYARSMAVRSFTALYRPRSLWQSPELRLTGSGDIYRVDVAGYLGSESVISVDA